MASLLDRVNLHPRSYDSCDLLVRNSDYETYPVLLAAKNSGVILVVDQGTGVGHVTTIELYDPALQ